MNSIVVVAPHPDDETIACGGTLLRHKDRGDKIHWILVTKMTEDQGFSPARIASRKEQIAKITASYPFDGLYELEFPTTMLDCIPIGDIVNKVSSVFKEICPNVVYLPYPGDIHSDHKVVFNAGLACTKWFRYPSVKRVLVYEALSETEFCGDPDSNGFRPNVYVDITNYQEKKLRLAEVYTGEMAEFPFPRSEEAMRALAKLRGTACGCQAAEAFMLIKEII
jgi:LmbE family N-acetylglucosaminyl deacetylase